MEVMLELDLSPTLKLELLFSALSSLEPPPPFQNRPVFPPAALLGVMLPANRLTLPGEMTPSGLEAAVVGCLGA
jgi:hypothetical protein